jgi:uncharacterized protein YueI|tara:strand:- start:630 stop:842 length:213 start_codon:yes stop_codon:yes gene_type:complete
MTDDETVALLNNNIQKFIKEQLSLTDNPLLLAGCLAAQLHIIYVTLLGEEDAGKLFKTMSTYKFEQPTMH